MENSLSQFESYFGTLKDWFLALSVIPLALGISSYLKSLILRAQKSKEGRFFRQLAPIVTTLVYVGGLALFVELAPLPEKISLWLSGICFVLTVVVGLYFAQRAAVLGFRWAAHKSKYEEIFDAGFVPLLQNVLTIFVLLTGSIIILKHFNYDVMSLITALGVGSLAVGLAAKDTLSNMISGFILIIDRNLKPGDRVNMNGALGDVATIGLRSTLIRTLDGNTLIVPNSDLVNNRILNFSIHTREIQSQLQIRVPFDTSFARTKELIIQVADQIHLISKEKPIRVNLSSLAEGYQTVSILLRILDYGEAASVVSQFHEKLIDALGKEQIRLVRFCKCYPGSIS
jgi:small-conductance mechanosensitive channel